MPDQRQRALSNFPSYLGGGRLAAFLLLILLAVLETGAQIWTGRALTGVIASAAQSIWPIASLFTAFAVLACLFWGRGVAAEWIGQNYVNDVRSGLARQAVRSALGRGRLGTISTRMSADLAALKNWSDAGICGTISGALTLTAGLMSALMIVGLDGFLSCLAGPAVSLLFVLVFWIPLSARIRLRRAARGLLSARTGDAVYAVRTAAVYSAFELFIRPIRRAGARLAAISVKTVSLVQLLRASGTITVPAGVLVFILLRAESPAVPASVWGGLIYALGLCSAGVSLLVLAVEALIERRIAVLKLRELDAQAREAPQIAPEGTEKISRKPVLALSVDGRILAPPGDSTEIARSDSPGLTMRLMKGGEGIALGDLQAPLANPRDWGRRVAIVSEVIPLPRGGLREVVRVRGRPPNRQVYEALLLAGIDPDNTGLPSVIDPQRNMIEPSTMARLRLVRGLICSPHALVIDEPWLTADGALKARLAVWASQSGCAVIWLVAS
jgi:ABC-type multidrug transport system fused ATPase/permease subunit